MSLNPDLVRDPKINRLLAREAVSAYRTGRKPDFKSVLQSGLSAQNLSIMKLMPYDFSSVEAFDPTRLN